MKKNRRIAAITALVLLAGLWFLRTSRTPHSPTAATPAPRSHAVPSELRRDATPPLPLPPGGATFGNPPMPLNRSESTNDWQTRRAAFRPPPPHTDPSHPRKNQILLVSGPVLLPDGARAGTTTGEATPRQTLPYIVQAFSEEQLALRKQRIEEAGARVHGYLPHNAWLVELTDDAKTRVEALPFVRATLAYNPVLRIQPWLNAAVREFTPTQAVELSIQTFLPEDAKPVAERLRATGCEVLHLRSTPGRRSGRVLAKVRLARIPDIATWAGVQWIEEHLPPGLRNDLATAAGHANSAPLRQPWGLTGEGQTVGHADTGLDTGDTNTVHRDVRGRVAASAWGRPGDWSDPDGHGTHTAGTIIGDGTMSGGTFAGAAPAARLFHQSVEDASGNLGGLYDIYALFQEAHDAGARIHSDSWGSDTAGAYDIYSREADEFAWDHPGFLPVFASGNAGVDTSAGGNGVVDAGSVGSPASAKNVLTVGASESDRAPGNGGLSSYSYGSFWSSDYPVNPIRNDPITWSHTPGPPYLQGVAAFSSRGPTADNRIKPEVVAPGADVLSLRSSRAASSWLNHPTYPADYTYNLGTSMATPLVAGSAALLRQALARVGHPDPTAALLRAMLAGGARSLAPGQYGTGATREIPDVLPSNVAGHGQIDIAGTLFPEAGQMTRLHDRLPVAEFVPLEIPVTLTASNSAFRAILAWSDAPATAGAGIALVNNLDLALLTPDGAVLKPTTIDASGTDTRNTIERVDLSSAVAGVYTVRVSVASLPDPDPERFTAALYLRGTLDEPPVLHHQPGDAFQLESVDPLSVRMAAHYHRAFAEDEAFVRYTLSPRGETPPPPQTWNAQLLSLAETIPGGWAYAAELPAPVAGESLHYLFAVDTGSHAVTNPATGHYTATGYVPIQWTVAGYPGEWGVVSPDYGTRYAIPGVPVTATASPHHETGTNQRVRCIAHLGEGGIPPFAQGSSVTFVLEQQAAGEPEPRLTWLWDSENALTQVSAPQGVVNRIDWFGKRTMAHTGPAPELAWDGEEEPYALTGWWVEGLRWPASTGPSPNPATEIPLSVPKSAEARYVPFWSDADANGLRDAWEERWTGSSNSALAALEDPDGDGWTNYGENLDNTDPNDPASYPEPPVLQAVTVFDNPLTSPPPYRVEATATDNFVVAAATLLWRSLGEDTWAPVPMKAQGGDRYGASFTPPFLGSATSEYCIVAADVLGYNHPEFQTTSAIHRVWSEVSHPALWLAPEAAWRLEGGATSSVTQEVAIANYGVPALEYALHLLGVGQRMEQETAPEQDAWDKWSSSGTALWRPVTRRATQGANAWYCGNTTTWQYANYLYAYLNVPAFTAGSNMVLAFDQWIKTEPDAGVYYWDGGILTCSLDGGTSWSLLTPIGGYPHKIVPNPASPFPDHQPCFGGRGEGWQPVTVDLTPYAGSPIIVSFEFGADGAVTDEGWYVDNVHLLSPDSPPTALSLAGATQGSLTFREQDLFEIRFDPADLPAGTHRIDTFLLAQHNDPGAAFLHPVTGRYGFTVATEFTGPGALSFEQALLFEGDSTNLVATAEAYADARTVTTNGISWATAPGTTRLDLPFSALREDVDVRVKFDWTVAEEGVPLWWLGRHGLTGETASVLYEDTDGDGIPNWQEYVANTSPTNSLSLLRIHALEATEDGWRLRWTGGPDRTVTVDRASALPALPGWAEEALLEPDARTDYELELTNAPTSFFRLRVLPPGNSAPPPP